jgi:hypothetical protein
MLIHVTPNEVAGLQALAQQNGSSLTINPHTGLPEAGVLDKFLPAIAGFALDYFVPGAGEAVGGLFGLEGAAASAVGSGLIVGGATGLVSGSLEQGLMAGLGAYGGASLSQGLGSMGSAANARAANAGFDVNNSALDAERVAAINQAASKPDVMAGIREASINPIDALKDNKWAIGAAALPAFASADQNSGIAALKNKGYIRRYRENPETGALEQYEAVPVDEFGSQSAVTFGGVGKPVKYDSGGSVSSSNYLVYNPTTKTYDKVNSSGDLLGPVTFGAAKSTNIRDPNDTRSDSQKAYDYLMGVPGAKNPMLFNYKQRDDEIITPPDLNTRTGGHYVINASKTGYDWVPDAEGTNNAGLEAIVNKSSGPGAPGMASNPGNIGTSMNGFDNAVNTIVGKILNALDPTVNPNKDTMDVVDAIPTPNDGSDAGDAGDGDGGGVGGSGVGAAGAPGPGASTGPSVGGGVGAAGAPGPGASPGGDGPGGIGTAGGPGTGGAPGPGVGQGIGTASSGSPSPGSSSASAGGDGGGVGPTCFVKGVLVTLANGKQVAIEDVEVGDVVRGQDGDNQVIAFDRPQLIIPDVRDGTLYGFNGGDKFITSEHPVMTKAGWKAIDQDKAKHFEPHLSEVLVGNLIVGDELLVLDGTYLVLESIETYTDQPQQQLYNLMLGGDHTYYVNGLLVHNKGGGDGGGGGGGGGGGEARGGLNLHGRYYPHYAYGGIAALAAGGLGQLGGYSDGGQLLRGPGDGVSDSIPATIGQGKPARLADGEFVVPARIVSELGNGSTEAGAKQLYAMMARIQAGRAKTTGKNQVAKNSKAARHLPA